MVQIQPRWNATVGLQANGIGVNQPMIGQPLLQRTKR
jgi:hypothetical protein